MRYATEADLADPSVVGGKAFNLARLSAFGAVPSFLVLVCESPGDDEPPAQLEARLGELDLGGLFAVRSSATAEDSDGASFPGLFETKLGVRIPEIAGSLTAVADSVSSTRVHEYVAARGLRTLEVRMSVVIQRMIDSEVAGVCLSRFSPQDQRSVVEAVWGLGEQLVGGEVAPDRYVVDVEGGWVGVEATAYQDRQLRLGPSGPVDEPVEPLDRNARKLESDQTMVVAELSRRVEAAFGWTSADIEFAFDNSGLHLLQARPFAGYAARPSASDHGETK